MPQEFKGEKDPGPQDGLLGRAATCSENLCNIQRRTKKTREGELETSGFTRKQSQVKVSVMLHVAMYIWPDVISGSVLLEAQIKVGIQWALDTEGDCVLLKLQNYKIG